MRQTWVSPYGVAIRHVLALFEALWRKRNHIYRRHLTIRLFSHLLRYNQRGEGEDCVRA